MSDRFQVRRFHHVEFWCTDAASAASRFSFGLGIPIFAKSDLSTGNYVHASILLSSGDLRLLFSAPYSPSITPPGDSTASIPTFDYVACRSFSASHGLAVRAIAVEVADAASAFSASISHGAQPASPPVLLSDGTTLAELRLYGDVVLRYISSNAPSSHQSFLPGFHHLYETTSPPLDFGIRRLDHAVGNVPELSTTLSYIKNFTGFHEFAEFTADEVGTIESGLNSVVLACNNETVLLAINEPVHGTKRKSQIQTYLEHNEGAGVQHLAIATDDIFKTLREIRRQSFHGGFELLPPPPPNYYRNLANRAGNVLTVEQIKECEELGILVDGDDQGTLLQIFTKPIGDRPTIFIEIIQRIGCILKDDEGNLYQKGGCGGFGRGNFSELFRCIEEYEKTLEISG